MVSRSSRQAVLATLIYSNIFDFPLTRQELWTFLISQKQISKQEFDTIIKKNSHIIEKDGYICLKGREKIITQRQKQKNEMTKKMTTAKIAAYYLSYIPSIKLIGISGSLAMGDAKKNDDIDFFIIVKKNTLWTTRLLVLALLEALHLRRKRGEKKAPDKICCNLIVEEDNIAWSKDKQNIYTAHEIVQLKPIFQRERMYEKFLIKNQWVKRYFQNLGQEKSTNYINIRSHKDYVTVKAILYLTTRHPVRYIIEELQKKHMKKHTTKETIEQKFLALHPHDYAVETIHLFNLGLKKYGLLTNN